MTAEQGRAYAAPHDEAEISVLGAMMLDAAAADEALARLTREDFEHPAHARIFTALGNLRSCGYEPDPLAVRQELRQEGLLEAAGGSEYLARIVEVVPTAANLRFHMDRVAEDAARRRLLATAQRVEKAVRANGRPSAELYAWTLSEWTKAAPKVAVAAEATRMGSLRRFLESGLSAPPAAVIPRLVFEHRLSLLASREKCGKSTLAAAAVAAKSAGARFLGEVVDVGPVLFVGIDEALADTARKLVRFGAGPDLAYLTDWVGDDPVATIRALVAETKAELVVIDSLAKLGHAAGVTDTAGSAEWIALLGPLADFAHQDGPGILLLHHARRSDNEYRDSSAIGATVDGIVTMHATDERERRLETLARWPAETFTVRLVGDLADEAAPLHYELASGELSVDACVLLYVENNPGCSQRAVRENVTGRAEKIRQTLAELVHRGALCDRPDARGSRFYAGHSGTAAEPVGNRLPVPDATRLEPRRNRSGTGWEPGTGSASLGKRSGNRSGRPEPEDQDDDLWRWSFGEPEDQEAPDGEGA